MELPRRGELVAACVVALLLVHLVFAQLTLVLAAVFAGVSRLSRWRLSWLTVPAAAGVVWTLVIGPGNAAHGFAAGPGHILSYLSAHGVIHVHGAFAGAGGWLPRQAPLALVAAAAEAAVAGWLDWLHTDEWALTPRRPGLVAAARRAAVTRAIRSGGVVTRNGGSLGVAPATGARVALSWDEAAAGVLFTGTAARDITATSLQLVHAALRLRKPLIALDLSGDPAFGTALAAACEATGTPLRTFGAGEDGSGCYEPFRHGEAERRADLMIALLGAGGAETTLRGALELIAEVPAGPQVPVLDDVLHLLNPMAMQARLGLVSGASPRAALIAERVGDAVRQAQSAPGVVASVVDRLEAVRKSPAGRWLRPAGTGHAGIDLSRVVRERSAALFGVDSPGMARLVCADLLALGEDLRRISVDGDGVVLVCGCEKLPEDTLARLVRSGTSAGLAVLATTTSAHAAAEMAATFGTLVIHRLADADARPGDGDGAHAPAPSLAARTGTRLLPLAASPGQVTAAVSAPFMAPVRGKAASPGAAQPVPPGASPYPAAAPASGMPVPGMPVPGTPVPGMSVSGMSVSGMSVSGMSVSGVPAPGVPASGVPASGVPASGVPSAGGARAGLPTSGMFQAGMYELVPQAAVPVQALLSLRTAQFVLAVSAPRPRLVELARTVPARLPRQPGPSASSRPSRPSWWQRGFRLSRTRGSTR